MRALYLKEIRSFLGSMIGYIFIVIFLIVTGLFLWIVPYETNLMQGAESDLIPFFNLAPMILFILIPAITMRTIAEERRSGTIELLYTRPMTDLSIILAKYFAGLTLMIIALLPTLIYYISMHYLGSPVGILDDGAAITSYFGLILLGASFVAVGIFASAITTSQIIAFILAMFLCWFLYDGLELLGAFQLLGSFDFIIQFIGMSFHYEALKKGVLNTSDVIYFLSIITAFLLAALTLIKSFKR
jgi:ABC-2 type transport system permease protein